MTLRDFLAILLFLALIPGAQALVHAQYSFEVTSTGESRGMVSINTTESILLPLPDDVRNPEVNGAAFTLINDGIELLPSTETIRVSYTSSYHTSKEEGVWTFIAEVLPASAVEIILPVETQVIRTKPRAALSKEDGLMVRWPEADEDQILVSYVIAPHEDQLLRAGPLSVQKFSLMSFEGLILVLILAGLLSRWIVHKRKTQGDKKEVALSPEEKTDSPAIERTVAPHDLHKDLPHITDAQMHVLRAANDNEATVLKIMLKHHGHLKRNQLERESGISKSSLASALKNLEGKNIIHIDRSFFVHYLTLSDWFKGLK